MTRPTKTILIHFEHLPIPSRLCDYVALFQGEEESAKYGYGPTPQEALQDLLDTAENEPSVLVLGDSVPMRIVSGQFVFDVQREREQP